MIFEFGLEYQIRLFERFLVEYQFFIGFGYPDTVINIKKTINESVIVYCSFDVLIDIMEPLVQIIIDLFVF